MARKVKQPLVRRVLNLKASRNTEQDWTYDKSPLGVLQLTAPPPSVDLRQPWWTVGDQGATGSCVGWAVADGLMRYHLNKNGLLSQTQRLSARFVWMCSKETDEFATRPESFIEQAGTTLKAAMDVVRKFGIVTDTMLPFELSTTLYTGDDTALWAAASQRRAISYFNLAKSLPAWKAWLALNGPIVCGVSVDKAWDDAGTNGGKVGKFQAKTVRGGHAVCVVGYTKDGVIVRNSWDESWGDNGFCYCPYAYVNAAFFAEAYGVIV